MDPRGAGGSASSLSRLQQGSVESLVDESMQSELLLLDGRKLVSVISPPLPLPLHTICLHLQ